MSDTEHLSMCLLAIRIASLVEVYLLMKYFKHADTNTTEAHLPTPH